MKTKNKYFLVAGLLGSMFLASCYEDKGNYTYSEVESIEITMPTGIVAMANSESVTFEPEVVSSLVGNVEAGNEDYEFNCKINYRHTDPETGEYLYWQDVNPEKSKKVTFFAGFPANTYTVWYSVTNKETGFTANAKGTVSIQTSTSEGWMVLSNVGAEKSVRLDMLFNNSKGEPMVAADILGEKAPDLKNATQVVLYPSMYAGQEAILLLSHSGGYRLDVNKLTLTETNNMKLTDFIVPNVPGEPISFVAPCTASWIAPISRFCVTSEGNAYAIRSATAGSSFEDPMNAEVAGEEPTYKVSPMIGASMARPGNSSCVLCYDVTNKRFVGWNYYATNNALLFALADPDDAERKFSYQTGMELVHMEGTRYSNGLVYSVLQDAQGKRHIYGINLSGSKFTQECIYSNIEAEHFNDATDYAFHSQFPFMFYSYGDKVYSYNLGTGMVNKVLDLKGETVTKLKFNLYLNASLAHLNGMNPTEEFLDKQFDLIVASTTGAENGGIVRFYDIDLSGQMSELSKFTGFGDEIVDVTYRERR